MKQKLLALALALSALGAGVIVFARWESGSIDPTLESAGSLEVVLKSNCTTSACSTTDCIQAQNVLTDAGSACVPRVADCDFRVGPRLRALATDAGVTLGPKKYQRLRMIALRCPGSDGGFVFGVPTNDAGWPVYSAVQTAPTCVRAPLDGGSGCRKVLPDGGSVFFGTGNVFPAARSTGTQCEQVACSVIFGDNPDTDL